MFLFATPQAPAPDSSEPDDPRAARQLAELDEIVAIGLQMLRDFGRQVSLETQAIAAGEAKGDPRSRETSGLAFDRVSRAIRLTRMLEARLQPGGADAEEPARVRWDGPPARNREEYEAVQRDHQRASERVARRFRYLARRAEVGDVVRQAIEVEASERGERFDRTQAEADLHEALERADAPEDMWLWRPLGEIAADICRAIGVRYDPQLWSDACSEDPEHDEAGEAESVGHRILRLYASHHPPPNIAGRIRETRPPPFWTEDA